jgi:hypothetical protein
VVLVSLASAAHVFAQAPKILPDIQPMGLQPAFAPYQCENGSRFRASYIVSPDGPLLAVIYHDGRWVELQRRKEVKKDSYSFESGDGALRWIAGLQNAQLLGPLTGAGGGDPPVLAVCKTVVPLPFLNPPNNQPK